MKIKDGICGFAVGDALGVPVEFSSRETLQKKSGKNNDRLRNIQYASWNFFR